MSKFFLVSVLLSMSLVIAQDDLPDLGDDTMLNRLQLQTAMMEELEEQIEEDFESASITGGKSIGRSVLMSAVLPGAGQFYSGSYLKAAAFVAFEVVGWSVNSIYNSRGDEKTDEHRAWVDEHWSEQRYWSYVYQQVNNNEAVNGFDDGIYDGNIQFDEQSRPLLTNWQDAEPYLNEFDGQLSGFTHHLPDTKTQQYYEMVGKYPRQFGNAWDDASFNQGYSGYTNTYSANNRTSEDLRFDLNELYDTAGYGSMIILVNHLVSAIDAGFTARGVNRRLELTYNKRYMDGERVNMLGMRMTW